MKRDTERLEENVSLVSRVNLSHFNKQCMESWILQDREENLFAFFLLETRDSSLNRESCDPLLVAGKVDVLDSTLSVSDVLQFRKKRMSFDLN
jgi:hypothetical protein